MCERLQQAVRLGAMCVNNRCVIPPMKIHACNPRVPGVGNDEHFVHYCSMAEGGAGLLMLEQCAVSETECAPSDLGVWSDFQVPPVRRIVEYIHSHTPVKVGLPLTQECDSWNTWPTQRLAATAATWAAAARRAQCAGVDCVALDFTQGSLVAGLLLPHTNTRTDTYGRDRAGRFRLALEIVRAVRAQLDPHVPLLCRLSDSPPHTHSTDTHAHSQDTHFSRQELLALCAQLAELGVVAVDCVAAGAMEVPIVSHKNPIALCQALRASSPDSILIVTGLALTFKQASKLAAEETVDLISMGGVHLVDCHYWTHTLERHNHKPPWHPQRHTKVLEGGPYARFRSARFGCS
eukprot:Gregarina_sp_Pseudo_9__1383@NODE_1927_length_1248_cov_7_791563_g1787_i0_p1_GENE_NODE_1927_length_1248_cov_7_791563_g1787_i0NODE_1927_length_1248_cov_7_791563_g1787_i0_p1_ORF_typecomplete_len349_score76_63Oxidored_FMN/PF00724_20/1_1e42TatD_DNase/PF01026_21/0_056HMGLlike/PF00682_19/1_2e03HMGLlike/PF00682_19/0_2Pantoate_transf/PF02548_15/9_2e02Pantoate_transf/PF02548_15/11Pantoate_transf/PF02548_15/30_NODE_1927_length_1248_cov_7_791563_g1787_i0601106